MGLTNHEKYKLSLLQEKKKAKMIPPVPKDWRTFVNINNGNDKFWKIGSVGKTVYTQYGANGTAGVEVTKEFNYYYEAYNYIIRKIKEKLNKGYEEL